MSHSIRIFLLLCLMCSSMHLQAQLPATDGERCNYNVQIDMRNAYFSGVCVMVRSTELVKCSMVNEFGVTVMEFIYDTNRDKLTLVSVMSMLDKWYIRRMLRKDLRSVMLHLKQNQTTYSNDKRGMRYTFTLFEK